MKNIIIIGGSSGSKIAKEIFESVNFYTNIYFAETFCEKYKSQELSDSYLDVQDLIINGYEYFIATGDNKLRSEIYNNLKKITGKEPLNCIHSSSIISESCNIGHGNLICPGAVLHTDSIIGNCTIVNTNSVIEHDCVLSDYSQISPNATLCGKVTIGEYSFIGAGSTIIPNINVGKNVIVAAGSVVINDIDNNVMVAGVPCVIKKRYEKN